jgi:hypothetical protein
MFLLNECFAWSLKGVLFVLHPQRLLVSRYLISVSGEDSLGWTLLSGRTQIVHRFDGGIFAPRDIVTGNQKEITLVSVSVTPVNETEGSAESLVVKNPLIVDDLLPSHQLQKALEEAPLMAILFR